MLQTEGRGEKGFNDPLCLSLVTRTDQQVISHNCKYCEVPWCCLADKLL